MGEGRSEGRGWREEDERIGEGRREGRRKRGRQRGWREGGEGFSWRTQRPRNLRRPPGYLNPQHNPTHAGLLLITGRTMRPRPACPVSPMPSTVPHIPCSSTVPLLPYSPRQCPVSAPPQYPVSLMPRLSYGPSPLCSASTMPVSSMPRLPYALPSL